VYATKDDGSGRLYPGMSQDGTGTHLSLYVVVPFRPPRRFVCYSYYERFQIVLQVVRCLDSSVHVTTCSDLFILLSLAVTNIITSVSPPLSHYRSRIASHSL
jgi:hypothetical protein